MTRRSGTASTVSAVVRLLSVVMGLGLVWFVSSSVSGQAAPGLVLAAAVLTAGALVAVVAARGVLAAIAWMLRATEPRHPAERIDLPASIVQSRPDAPGRPQPRAPGHLLTVV
ncbi:DUF6412 domain-containing protein [Herbiconiux solani]|uniref:DUF6412 domain-containing protein n=1 Tax=Herbiconiux solani TaxID=661329 RepID=UPI000B2757CF|nr:DUF6412 domain-containing protein [Herbiconiux solani]